MIMKTGLVIVGIVVCSAENALADTLSGEQIKSEVAGKTLVAKRMGMEMKLSLNKHGTALARSPMKNGNGNWAIDGDKLCIFIEGRSGRESPCQGYTKIGERRLKSSGGTEFEIRP